MHQGKLWQLVKSKDPLRDVVDQPVDASEEVETSDRAALDDLPVVADDAVQLQHLLDLLQAEGTWKILLVGKDKESGTEQPLLLQQPLQLLPAVLQPSPVRRVDHPDEAVRRLKIVPPVGTQGLLASDIPDVELESPMVQRLNVEA